MEGPSCDRDRSFMAGLLGCPWGGTWGPAPVTDHSRLESRTDAAWTEDLCLF